MIIIGLANLGVCLQPASSSDCLCVLSNFLVVILPCFQISAINLVGTILLLLKEMMAKIYIKKKSYYKLELSFNKLSQENSSVLCCPGLCLFPIQLLGKAVCAVQGHITQSSKTLVASAVGWR